MGLCSWLGALNGPLIKGCFVFDKMLPAFIWCIICAEVSLRESKFKSDIYFLTFWIFIVKLFDLKVVCSQIRIVRSCLSVKKLFFSKLSSLCGDIGTNSRICVRVCVQCMSLQRNNTAGLWGVGGRLKKKKTSSLFPVSQKYKTSLW